MFRQADLSQLFLGNTGPLKRQNEQRTQYFRDYKKFKRSRQFLKEWKQTVSLKINLFYMHQYTMTSEIYI
jgi:hypothetical protein